jgi:lysophospholipase L1-like esterase
MLRRLSGALCAVVFILPAFAEEKPNPAVTPAEKNPERHKRFLEEIKKRDGKIDVVFLGDSITDGWGGNKAIWDAEFGKFNPLNLGIGGDRTQHVLWRIQHDELKGYTPKAFVIMIGTNNMPTQDTPEQIAAGNKAIIDEIQKQHPKAKILLLAIFPRSAKPMDAYREKIKKTNELLSKFASDNVTYKDIGNGFLKEDGSLPKEIMYDYLHLTKEGYQIWANSIKKELEEMTK